MSTPIDSPRIVELRRRVQADPSSIAFAQLAEEYRRAGNYEEAIRVCRAGLQKHPGYLSARVTLGRAMMEVGQLDDAEVEFDLVLGTAPDNLAAIRGVAEINQRRGDLPVALGYYQAALGLARHDPDLEETVSQISKALADAAGEQVPGMSFEEAKTELLSAADRLPPTAEEIREEASAADGPPLQAPVDEPGNPPDSMASPAASESAAVFNFDELLQALGQPASTPAPPQVEAWLSGAAPVPASSAAEPSSAPPSVADEPSAARADASPSDILGRIEEDLRRFESEPSPGAGPIAEPPAPESKPTEQAALDELERWLEVLEDARRPSPPV